VRERNSHETQNESAQRGEDWSREMKEEVSQIDRYVDIIYLNPSTPFPYDAKPEQQLA